MRLPILAFVLGLLCFFDGNTQSLNTGNAHNKTIIRLPRIGTDNPFQDKDQVETSIQYTDGFGRPLQTIQYRLSPSGKDMVSAMGYDALGRQEKSYLPYAVLEQDGRYRTNPEMEANNAFGDAAAFTKLEYDEIGRPRYTYGPGASWQTAGKRMQENVEVMGADQIRRYEGGNDSRNFQVNGNSFYQGGVILKSTVTDEDGKTTIQYNTREGLLVRSDEGGLTTHYAYDELDRLTCIIPPKVSTTNFDIQSQQELVFAFRYDNQGRKVETLNPGGGWTELVYDRLGRVIMSRNSRLVDEGKWVFSKYDGHARVIMTGWISSNASRETWQLQADAQTSDVFDHRGSGVAGYAIRSIPSISENNVMIVHYFDDYNWGVPGDLGCEGGGNWGNVQGMATGTKVRNLDGNGWLETVPYYDNLGRIMQVQSRSRFGGRNSTFSQYSFTGQVTEERTIYRKPNQSDLEVKNKYEYDHAGRKRFYKHAINNQELTVAEYVYDELGRLALKKIQPGSYSTGSGGSTYPSSITRNAGISSQEDIATSEVILSPNFDAVAGTTYTARIGISTGGNGGTTDALQRINYSYTVRGHVHSINEGSLNASENDLFAHKLTFQEDNRYYAGQLSKQFWQTKSNPNANRGYTYSYDNTNRLKTAAYSATAGFSGENYSLDNVDYDVNGNITQLLRNGVTSGSASNPTSFGRIDQLSYEYLNGGNRLRKVSDAISSSTGLTGFKDRYAGDDYEYYADGSLKVDRNREITSIIYNYLGLPEKFVLSNGREIFNGYDATGQKLYKVIRQSGQSDKRIDYVGDVIYQNGIPSYIFHDEGRVMNDAGGNLSVYEYHYRDHQGNLRVAYRQQGQSVRQLSTNEPINQLQEERAFTQVSKFRSPDVAYQGQFSARVWGGSGPFKTMQVEPGETVSIQVYAHFQEEQKKRKRNFFIPVPWLQKRQTLPTEHPGNGGYLLTGGVIVPVGKGNVITHQAGEIPLAYLQVSVIDSAGNTCETRRVAVTKEAGEGWQELNLVYQASHLATLKVEVINTSLKPTYFDNLSITSQPPVIVQENHYDPWGINLVGIEVAGSPEDPFQYQGKERENSWALELDDFGWRTYDPQIGRWQALDKAALAQSSYSPYQSMMNNPAVLMDPDGNCPVCIGAFFGAFSYLIQTAIRGPENFTLKGFLTSTALGAIGAAIAPATSAIGQSVTGKILRNASPVLKSIVSQAISGGLSGGALSGLGGGNVFSGFTQGFVRGGAMAGLSTGANKLKQYVANNRIANDNSMKTYQLNNITIKADKVATPNIYQHLLRDRWEWQQKRNAYGPWTPGGFSVNVAASGNVIVFGGSAQAGLAFSGGKLAVVYGGGLQFGAGAEMPGGGLSLGLNIHDAYGYDATTGGAPDIIDGLGGQDYGTEISTPAFSVGYSATASPEPSHVLLKAPSAKVGVRTYSLGIGIGGSKTGIKTIGGSWGAKRNISFADVIRIN